MYLQTWKRPKQSSFIATLKHTVSQKGSNVLSIEQTNYNCYYRNIFNLLSTVGRTWQFLHRFIFTYLIFVAILGHRQYVSAITAECYEKMLLIICITWRYTTSVCKEASILSTHCNQLALFRVIKFLQENGTTLLSHVRTFLFLATFKYNPSTKCTCCNHSDIAHHSKSWKVSKLIDE